MLTDIDKKNYRIYSKFFTDQKLLERIESRTITTGQDCKEVKMYSTYNVLMLVHPERATKKIPVCPSTWEEIQGLRKPGQTFDEVIREMVKKEKLSRLAEDIDQICQRDRFVEYKL